MGVLEYLLGYFEEYDVVERENALSDPFIMKEILEKAGFDLGDLTEEKAKELERSF